MTTYYVYPNGDCLELDARQAKALELTTLLKDGDVLGEGASLHKVVHVGESPALGDYNALATVLFGTEVRGTVFITSEPRTKVGRLLRTNCPGGFQPKYEEFA